MSTVRARDGPPLETRSPQGIAGFVMSKSPEVAIIMCGKDNTYRHPHQETLDKLAAIEVYRTDLHGTIVITTDGQTYNINRTQPYIHQKIPATEPDPGKTPTGRININAVNHEQLQEIIHIGPARAEEIIRLRPFKTLDDLIRVNGIGPASLKDIKDEGKAYVE